MTETLKNLTLKIAADLQSAQLGFAMLCGYLEGMENSENPPNGGILFAAAQSGCAQPPPHNDSPDIQKLPLNEHIGGDDDMHLKYGDGSIKRYYRTTKNGTRRCYWRARIYIDNKQISVYAKTQAECLGKLKELQKNRNTEDTPLPSNDTFNQNRTYAEWLELWVKLCKEDKIKNTYRNELAAHVAKVKAALGQYKLRELKPLNILTYIKSLPRRNLTVKLYDIINGSLQKAADFGIIKLNPCKALDRPTFEAQERRAFELSEQCAILDTLEGKHKRAFFFLCATGLRVGEFLALKREDVDFERGIISVSRSMNIQTGEIVPPKTKNSVRRIYFAPELFDEFHLDDFGTYTYSGVKKAFLKVYRRLNLKNISLTHSCRHTFASMLCACGLPIKIVQMLLGHAAFSTTMDIYTNVLLNGTSPIYSYVMKLKDEVKKRLL